jgi:hypothetical protein
LTTNINTREKGWDNVLQFMQQRFDKEADVKSVLFIIGLREYGHKKKKFTKEDKQDLMNLALCTILTDEGYFSVSHLDAEGWPVWKQSKALPTMSAKEQEDFIKDHIVTYFIEEGLIEQG